MTFFISKFSKKCSKFPPHCHQFEVNSPLLDDVTCHDDDVGNNTWCFSSLSLSRSSAFQDRQIRNLFNRHYKQRSHFKEVMMRYEVYRSQTIRRGKQDRDKLDELERREAFLQGRKEHLLKEIKERLAWAREEEKEYSTTMFGSPTTTAKIRRTETVGISKGRSSFQDSGNLIFFSLISVTLPWLSFLNQIAIPWWEFYWFRSCSPCEC